MRFTEEAEAAVPTAEIAIFTLTEEERALVLEMENRFGGRWGIGDASVFISWGRKRK